VEAKSTGQRLLVNTQDGNLDRSCPPLFKQGSWLNRLRSLKVWKSCGEFLKLPGVLKKRQACRKKARITGI
jgi:hypothetical protein